MIDADHIAISYDGRADTLYLTRERGAAVRGREDDYGIVWRFSATGTPLSAIVMDFREHLAESPGELASSLAAGFHISLAEAAQIVTDAAKQQKTR